MTKPYKFPTEEGALGWSEMKQLITNASMVVLDNEIATIRGLLMESLIRLGYLFCVDYTRAWDTWGECVGDGCVDEVAEVVDRMSQYLRYLMQNRKDD